MKKWTKTIKGSLFIKIYKTRQIKLQIYFKKKIIQVYYLKHNYHNYNLT